MRAPMWSVVHELCNNKPRAGIISVLFTGGWMAHTCCRAESTCVPDESRCYLAQESLALTLSLLYMRAITYAIHTTRLFLSNCARCPEHRVWEWARHARGESECANEQWGPPVLRDSTCLHYGSLLCVKFEETSERMVTRFNETTVYAHLYRVSADSIIKRDRHLYL